MAPCLSTVNPTPRPWSGLRAELEVQMDIYHKAKTGLEIRAALDFMVSTCAKMKEERALVAKDTGKREMAGARRAEDGLWRHERRENKGST